jgi:DNA polymerase III delta prime subunit
MHAFLIVGNNKDAIKIKTDELAKKYSAKMLEYPLIKIENVRNLNNFLRLTVTEPTLIVSNNIEEAGTEALNAFLKNLEEPQENLYFVLTTHSIQKVLPTIVSRCEIIKVKSEDLKTKNETAEKFINMTVGAKLKEIDKIKDRLIALALYPT